MAGKIQRDSSTLKIIRNAATGKVQRTVTGPHPCYICVDAGQHTSSHLHITFRDILLCDGCYYADYFPPYPGWFKHFLNFDINRSFILDQDIYAACYWEYKIPSGYTRKFYSDSYCSNLISEWVFDIFIRVEMLSWGTPPYYYGHRVSCAWGVGELSGHLFWHEATFVPPATCIIGTVSNELSCDARYAAHGGTAEVIDYCPDTPIWLSSIAYQLGNAVRQGDWCYRCILAHTNHEPPNSTYWEIIIFEYA